MPSMQEMPNNIEYDQNNLWAEYILLLVSKVTQGLTWVDFNTYQIKKYMSAE